MTTNKQKKTWIGIKRGFIIDPKHRQAIGKSVWLYQFMIDRANWETGEIEEWTDTGAAEIMDMELPTLRRQRRKLDELDYITCEQKQHGQRIIIHKWINPRNYSGKVINLIEGVHERSSSEGEGVHKRSPSNDEDDHQDYSQGDTLIDTPSIDSPDHLNHLKDIGDAPASQPSNGIELLPVSTKTGPVPKKNYPTTNNGKKEPDERSSHPAIKCVHEAWTLRAYNPMNLQGQLSWYHDGIPERKSSNGNNRFSAQQSQRNKAINNKRADPDRAQRDRELALKRSQTATDETG